jgi:UDP-N-acetylmuramate--alanine ligase
MAAVAIGLDLDIPAPTILQALESYTGIGRRFELKKKINEIMIIEDYAHHPTEIKATLNAAKRGWMRRIITIFQPHRYSRLSLLLKSFATSFNQADILIISDIYPAGEKPISGISGKVLVEEIRKFGHRNVFFEPELKEIAPLLKKLVLPKDILFIMGAGNIYTIIPEIIKTLEGST